MEDVRVHTDLCRFSEVTCASCSTHDLLEFGDVKRDISSGVHFLALPMYFRIERMWES